MDNTINQDDKMDLLKELTNQDFLDVGMDQVAYIRRVENNQRDQEITSGSYSVHAADGSQISVMDSYDMAVASIRVNDLFPVTVH